LEDFDGVESVVVEAPLGHGVTQYYAEDGEPEVADPSSFPAGSGHVIGSQTDTANYTPLHAEDATAPDYDPLAELPGPVLDDGGPSDTFEAMEVYKSGPADVQKGMAAILSAVAKRGYKLGRGNFLGYGPKYFTFKEGAKHNKYHVFTVLKLDNGMAIPANSYGRIGYPHAATWLGPAMSETAALAAIRKKVHAKERKGYNLEFGAEGDSAPGASHPTEYDPLAASPTDEGGPSASYGWDAADSDVGAFSAEFIANAEDMYCAECFQAHCGGHAKDAEDGPSPLDYNPLTTPPSGEGGPPTGPSADFEAEHSLLKGGAGVGIILGLIAAYKYSDKISDLFAAMADE
jgi:predicted DNA-binding WGR domain protein